MGGIVFWKLSEAFSVEDKHGNYKIERKSNRKSRRLLCTHMLVKNNLADA